jgi:hypothetical protein
MNHDGITCKVKSDSGNEGTKWNRIRERESVRA